MSAPSSAPPAASRPRARRRPASRAGILTFVVGVLALAVLGSVIMLGSDDPAGSPGALLFVASPFLMAVGLRTLGREGWADAGLGLGRERRWYLVALLLFPTLSVATLAIGALAGYVRIADGAVPRLLTVAAGGLVLRTIFALLEEWGWRGYLEPRLAALGVPPLRRHLLVGAVWAVWHVPYVLAMGAAYSRIDPAVQIPMFCAAVLAMAVIEGVMRDRTGSVWPAVLSHGVSNTIAYPLLDQSLVVIDHPLLVAARPESVVMLTLLIGTATVLYRRWGRSAPVLGT